MLSHKNSSLKFIISVGKGPGKNNIGRMVTKKNGERHMDELFTSW